MAVPYPEILIDLGELLSNRLLALGLSQEKAAEEAFEITEYVRKHWGGQDLYIPKGKHLELQEKYERVFEAWRARGFHPEITQEFDLSMMRLRQIVHSMRLARRQPVTSPALPFVEAEP